jgi:ABC-type sugar transport system ATPase subunit
MQSTSAPPSGVAPTEALPLLRMTGIYKRFQGVQALQDVELVVDSGEIHALVGGNGAGKSTLLNILSGLTKPDAGMVELEGTELSLEHPRHAQRLGITTIHQELSTIPDLTVIENILLGQDSALSQGSSLLVNRRAVAKSVEPLAREFGISRNELWTPVREFGALKKRAIEIVKALAVEPKILILDEPTSGLEDHEKSLLFDHMRSLQRRGVALIWVTHHLDEVSGLADVATVLRDGRSVIRTDVRKLKPRQLAGYMFGTEAAELIDTVMPETAGRANMMEEEQPRLKVEHLSRAGILRDISFELRAGEILGIAGLAGAGRTELVRALMGMDKVDTGRVEVAGKLTRIRHPRTAHKAGLAMVPEDRKQLGILSEFSVAKSVSVSKLSSVSRGGLLNERLERRLARKYIERLGVKTPSTREKIRNLSGGNQQKVIISRCLNTDPRILIFDEPTQGIDVHAKVEVHKLIRDLAVEGTSVLLIASEFTELISLSDRVIVLNRGSLVGEIDNIPQRVRDEGFDSVKSAIIDRSSRVGQ